METARSWFQRQVAVCLMFLLAAPLGVAAQQETPPVQQAAATSAQIPPQTAQLADAAPLPDSPNPAVSPAAAQSSTASPQSSSSQTTPQQQNGPSQPLGTAAAPYEPGTGVAASRPSGAAIAPARQKRTRSFMIRVGLLIGAAVAVGTVIALSSASPSQPSAK